jgi:hypothetical protein
MTIPAADYPFMDVFWSMIIFFCWCAWIWTLVVILTDVFRRADLSGWGKAAWTIFVIVLPFLGVLVYLIAHGKDMGERRLESVGYSGAYMPPNGGGSSPASQIAEAKRLLDSGAIDAAEFTQLKAKALA